MSIVRNAQGGWTKNKADDEYETCAVNIEEMIALAGRPASELHIWEPFVCSGEAGEFMRATGATVTETETDFFETEPPPGVNIVISNPPFSSKRHVMRRLCEIGLPFILIVPVTTACYEYTHKLVHEYGGFHVAFPAKQALFRQHGEIKGRPPFHSIYLCRGTPPPAVAWIAR